MNSEHRVYRAPPALSPGSRVALICPSGPLGSDAEVAHAVQAAERAGWEPVVGAHAMSRDGYCAGTDAERASDLRHAIEDDAIDGIWCIRGGYGAMRLLHAGSPDLVARHPKLLIGYSDITALHSVWQQAGLISIHGQTARAELTPFTRKSLSQALRGENSVGAMPDATTLHPGTATGRLMGGNLALVASLCGTPWAIDFTDAIVVLEDIGEATYRIDRMLTQLRLAGAFDGCAGMVFGQFTDCREEADVGAKSVEDVIRDCASRLDVPAVCNAPFGHVPDQVALPLGALATLDASVPALNVHPWM